MATHLEPGVKQSVIWTDKLVVGGSDPLQTAGPVCVMESSGTDFNLVASGTISGTELAMAGAVVGNAELANDAASGTKVSSEFGTIAGAGSPIVFGASIMAGSGLLSGGSDAWVVFPVGFAAAPTSVVLTNTTGINANELFVEPGSTNAGSFFVEGEVAADTFYWMAVGSGRL